MKIRNIQLNDIELHTEYFGNVTHPVCLLISGAMASARSWSDSFCESLVEHGYFVIRYDHRDIGESSAVDWQKKPYTLFDLADDAVRILDSYGIQQAHFVGHSMGGHICQMIALKYPERILSIAAIASGPIASTEETDFPLTNQEKVIQNKTWEIFLSRKDGDSVDATIGSFLPVWRYLNGLVLFDEEMAEKYTRDLLLRSHHKICAGNNHELVMRHLEIDRFRGMLRNITIPTLVIHGEQDFLALPRDGIALAHAIPNAELVMIQEMGHMFFNRELEAKMISLLVEHFIPKQPE